MGAPLHLTVSTSLDREHVWSAFTDLENWPKFSPVEKNPRWSGFPWEPGSAILARITHPRELTVRYVLERCDPAQCIRYIGHSDRAGFAFHRQVRFSDSGTGTEIQVVSYVAAPPSTIRAGERFVSELTEHWFQGFAAFCDSLHSGVPPVHPGRDAVTV